MSCTSPSPSLIIPRKLPERKMHGMEGRTKGWTEGQALIHRTVPATARGLISTIIVTIIAIITIIRNPKHKEQVREKRHQIH